MRVHSQVSSLKLEYWDRFLYDGSPCEGMYAELFDRNSPIIPSFLLETAELVHSHVGYFEPLDGTHKTLINVNVDAMDVPIVPPPGSPPAPVGSKRTVGVYSIIQHTHIGSGEGEWAPFEATLDGMHVTSKRLFDGVIVRSMAERISLGVV
jgi:hypothetical protein